MQVANLESRLENASRIEKALQKSKSKRAQMKKELAALSQRLESAETNLRAAEEVVSTKQRALQEREEKVAFLEAEVTVSARRIYCVLSYKGTSKCWFAEGTAAERFEERTGICSS